MSIIPLALWEHLRQHGEYQFIFWYRSPLQWNPRVFRLKANSLASIKGWALGTLIMTFVALNAVGLILCSFLKVTKITFFTRVVSLGEIIIASFGNVLSMISLIDEDVLCQCLNGIFHLARKPPQGAILVPSRLQRKLPKVERAMLMIPSVLRLCVIFSPAAALMLPFTLTSEPLYFLFDYILHNIVFTEKSLMSILCEKLIRGVLLAITIVHLFMDVYQFITFLMIILSLQLKLFSLTFVKQRAILANDMKNKMQKTWLIADEFTAALKFHFVYKLYRKIELVSILHDEMTLILYPILFALAYAGGVLVCFIVCVGYNSVSLFVYILSVTMTFVVAFVFSCIFPRFCDFDVCSIEFQTFWKRRLKGKYNRVRLASLRPVRIGILPFFRFRKSQYLFVVWNMISFSITILLTFKDGFEH